jgi:hypothetical protein
MLTLSSQGVVPFEILCRLLNAMLPFGKGHTQEQPCLEVNPAEGTATPRA